jgi:hypothetical protein
MGSVRILLATDIENGKMLRSRFLEVRPPGYGFVASPLVSRYVSTPSYSMLWWCPGGFTHRRQDIRSENEACSRTIPYLRTCPKQWIIAWIVEKPLTFQTWENQFHDLQQKLAGSAR